MNVKGLCLAILFRGDTTGYDIRKASSEGDYSYFAEASFGSIYPALNRLEAEELVTCRLEPQEGKPARKVYSITDAGRQAFLEELSQPPKPDVFRSGFLLVAIYAKLLGPKVIEKALDLRLEQLNEELNCMTECKDKCSPDETNYDPLIAAAGEWTRRYGAHVITASIAYLKENRAQLMAIANGELPIDLSGKLAV
ncbi:PadR family transcriptional regulator [Cohaesibacter gelatinilyticus]|uniref:Transcriptional regulator, PadR family n=1 Tax=Cohaesibacter gelatinilyticus TaxID=372072 RepID=A0A285NEA2_9HYPH|nr:PadR family transcriptional regulator [Cohaesibacter gelatinilyticus]SNZ07287.1 transcriptional regulator, PadR family [Cohaesibacter gelatinilyticus]HAT86821.1 PadR family transcriptional regulator [Hyphomicrobiales bacterium]